MRGLYRIKFTDGTTQQVEKIIYRSFYGLLEQRFAAYSQKRVNEGFQPPQEWPDDLAEERAKTLARLKVAEDEDSGSPQRRTESCGLTIP